MNGQGFFLLAPEMELKDHQASQEHIGDSGELHGGQPGFPGGGGGEEFGMGRGTRAAEMWRQAG